MRNPLLLLVTAGAMAALPGAASAQSVTYENTVKKIVDRALRRLSYQWRAQHGRVPEG